MKNMDIYIVKQYAIKHYSGEKARYRKDGGIDVLVNGKWIFAGWADEILAMDKASKEMQGK